MLQSCYNILQFGESIVLGVMVHRPALARVRAPSLSYLGPLVPAAADRL